MNKQAAILLSLTGFLVITSMYVYTHLGVSMDTDNLGEMNYHLYHEEPIDVVYTWVNGSDPVWLKEMLKFKRLSNGSTIAMVDEDNVDSNKTEDTASANRYRDNHELKYSIRSLFKYAPWIRHIYLVTNGQVPRWLNLFYPRVTVVQHKEIFLNQSHLPVFSSPAIEMHLHRIPGLSRKFIYFNDDVMLGAPVWPEDFFSVHRGQKVYFAWEVPKCAPGCMDSWIGDGFCDQACNNSACMWDATDCVNVTRNIPSSHWSQGSAGFKVSYCNDGCPNNWVGDKVCDIKCNHASCGWDGSDCGMEVIYNKVPGDFVDEECHVAHVPAGAPAVYVNFSAIIPEDVEVESGDISASKALRTSIIAEQPKVLILIMDPFEALPHVAVSTAKGSDKKACMTAPVPAHPPAQHLRRSLAAGAFDDYYYPDYPYPMSDDYFLDPYYVDGADAAPSDDSTVATAAGQVPLQPGTEGAAAMHNTSCEGFRVWLSYKFNGTTVTKELLVCFHHLVGDLHHESLHGNSSAAFANITATPSPVAVGRRLYARRQPAPSTSVQPLPIVKHRALASITSMAPEFEAIAMAKTLGGAISPFYEVSGASDTSAQEHTSSAVRKAWQLVHAAATALRFEESKEGEPEEEEEEANAGVGDLLSRAAVTNGHHRGARRLLDTYGKSLVHTNKLLKMTFEIKHNRKVPAHMPHMIDRDVVESMEAKWKTYMDDTSSHRFRSAEDLQYAFAYFYWIMEGGSAGVVDVNSIWQNELDTNRDGFLNENELRTVAAVLAGGTPTRETWQDIKNCFEKDEEGKQIKTSSVTLAELVKCKPAMKGLQEWHLKQKRWEEGNAEDVSFEMITDNFNETMNKLDSIRARRTKFICINDDMHDAGPDLLQLLQDFFQSYYPIPSPVELPPSEENPFDYLDDIKAASLEHHATILGAASFLVLLFAIYLLSCRSRKNPAVVDADKAEHVD